MLFGGGGQAASCGPINEPCIIWGEDRTNPFVAARGDNLQDDDAAFCQITTDSAH